MGNRNELFSIKREFDLQGIRSSGNSIDWDVPVTYITVSVGASVSRLLSRVWSKTKNLHIIKACDTVDNKGRDLELLLSSRNLSPNEVCKHYFY